MERIGDLNGKVIVAMTAEEIARVDINERMRQGFEALMPLTAAAVRKPLPEGKSRKLQTITAKGGQIAPKGGKLHTSSEARQEDKYPSGRAKRSPADREKHRLYMIEYHKRKNGQAQAPKPNPALTFGAGTPPGLTVQQKADRLERMKALNRVRADGQEIEDAAREAAELQ